MDVFLRNQGTEQIRLMGAAPKGTGLGQTVGVVRVEASPNQPGLRAVPSTAYQTEPPAILIDGECHFPDLQPLEGFTLAPGQEMRLWIVLEGEGAGHFAFTGWDVSYAVGGRTFRQEVPQGQKGNVRIGVQYPLVPPAQRACSEVGTSLN